MKQLQISVPIKTRSEVKEILESYSSDISVSEAEKNEKKVAEFSLTVDSNKIDDLTKKLKDLKDIKSGDLAIRVIKQESLIEKGVETRGSSTTLSKEEIYSKAQEVATFGYAQWSLVAISAIIAAYGIVSDNLVVVIGAMMLAPVLAPFVSGALSLNVGDRKLMIKSFKTGLLSSFLAILAATLAVTPFSIHSNELLLTISTPGIYSVLLSVFVGAAAALTFLTDLRDQVAGVAVAIALIPPLASVGIGVNLLDPEIVLNSLTVTMMNMSALVVSGFLTFRLAGLKPATYYKKKQAEKIQYLIPLVLAIFCILALYTAYDSEFGASGQDIVTEAEDFFGDRLLQTSLQDERIVLYVLEDADASEFEFKESEEFEVEIVTLKTGD